MVNFGPETVSRRLIWKVLGCRRPQCNQIHESYQKDDVDMEQLVADRGYSDAALCHCQLIDYPSKIIAGLFVSMGILLVYTY